MVPGELCLAVKGPSGGYRCVRPCCCLLTMLLVLTIFRMDQLHLSITHLYRKVVSSRFAAAKKRTVAFFPLSYCSSNELVVRSSCEEIFAEAAARFHCWYFFLSSRHRAGHEMTLARKIERTHEHTHAQTHRGTPISLRQSLAPLGNFLAPLGHPIPARADPA